MHNKISTVRIKQFSIILLSTMLVVTLASCTKEEETKVSNITNEIFSEEKNNNNSETTMADEKDWTEEEMKEMEGDHIDDSEEMMDDKEEWSEKEMEEMEGNHINDDKKIMDTDGEDWTEEEMREMEGEHMNDSEEIMEEKEEVVMKAGTYKTYSGEDLSNLGEKTVLFFAATWCPSCVAADKNLTAEGDLAEGMHVLKIDYDSNKDLRTKYGVTSQHTFILVDEKGEMIKEMVGGNNSADLNVLYN